MRWKPYQLGPLLLVAFLSSDGRGSVPEPPDPVAERQLAMEAVSERMKELAQMARKPDSFDREGAVKRAREIAQYLLQAQELFRSDTERNSTETWAKPEIWQKPEEFANRFQVAHERARALTETESAEALSAALRALGQSCKSCHELYRRPKG